jgi:drug/metabolite transporter (DMT)-like permease
MAVQVVCIGPAYTLTRWAAQQFDPFTVQLLRVWGAALVFAFLFAATGRFAKVRALRLPRRRWWQLVGIATLGIVLNQFLFTYGLANTTPTSSSLIYALTPLVVLIIGAAILRQERFTALKLLAVVVAFAGVLTVFLSMGRDLNGHSLGNGITLVALCCWSTYLIIGRRVFAGLDALTSTGLVMMIGAAVYTPVGLVPALSFPYETITWQGWVGLLTLVLVNSVLSFLILNYALTGLQSSQVAIYNNVQPLTAALFSVVIVHEEELSSLFALGGILVLVGVLALNVARLREYRTVNSKQ